MLTVPAMTENAAPAVRPSVSLEELAASFGDFVDASPATVQCYVRNVARFMAWLKARNVSRPTPADVLAYKRELAATVKPATASAYLAAVRVFFRWTATLPEGAGHYDNIAAGVKGIRTGKGHKKGHFTSRQVRMILETAHGETLAALRDYALLALMFGTGLRAVEAARADVSDIRTLGDTVVLYIQGKGRTDKTDFVKLAGPVEDALRAYIRARGPLPDDAPLFASTARNCRGKRLPANTIGRLLKAAFRAAGFDSPMLVGHSTRATAATQAFIAGSSLYDVQKLLRHADPATTEIYLHGLDRLSSRCEEDLAAAFF